MASDPASTPPPLPQTFQTRLHEVLLALYRHPLSKSQLLDLNLTFTHPFPVTFRRRSDSVRRQSRVLENLLNHALKEGWIKDTRYSIHGVVTRYFYLQETGFQKLFPGQPLPKKTYRSGQSQKRTTRRSSFFQPIAHRDEYHEEAVAKIFVHCAVQAKRDFVKINSCSSRNRLCFHLSGAYALRTPLAPLVRLHPVSNDPLPLKFYPDLVIDFATPDGKTHLRAFEADGGVERLLKNDEVKNITNMVQKYDRHREHYDRDYRVPFVSFRSPSRERLKNVMAVVRDAMRDPHQPLFLFSTLEHFLAENGALTRPRFLDHFGKPAPCLPIDSSLLSPTCSQESGAMERLKAQLEHSCEG